MTREDFEKLEPGDEVLVIHENCLLEGFVSSVELTANVSGIGGRKHLFGITVQTYSTEDHHPEVIRPAFEDIFSITDRETAIKRAQQLAQEEIKRTLLLSIMYIQSNKQYLDNLMVARLQSILD